MYFLLICIYELMFYYTFIEVYACIVMKVKKQKAIYHTLNMLSIDVTKKCLVGEGWSPVFATQQVISLVFNCIASGAAKGRTFIGSFTLLNSSVATYVHCFHSGGGFFFLQIQEALHRATHDSNSQVDAIFRVLPTREMPPTYFQTNKFTSAFQEIVDAYG